MTTTINKRTLLKTGAALAAGLAAPTLLRAQATAVRWGESLNATHPQVLMAGMGQYLDAVLVSAKASTFTVEVKLDQRQVDDLIGRVKGLLGSLGGALP